MDQDDPEKRSAELERQLAEAKAAARGQQVLQPTAPPAPTPGAMESIAGLAGEMAAAWDEHLRTGSDWGAEIRMRRDRMNRAVAESGLSPTQFHEVYSQALRQARLDRQFGVRRPAGFVAAPVDSRLAEPPRRIPTAFLLAELLPFRWWYIWALSMVGIAPIAVWMSVPLAFPVAAVLALLGIYAFNFRGTTKRFALLTWGQVATVTGSQITSRGTYYSGTTYFNCPLPVAHGWMVRRPFYSGPSTKTRIRYTVNGFPGELSVSGREYYDGVVLADRRNPARALCVTSIPYDLDRDESGNWTGRLRPALMVGMAVWVVIVIGWLAAAAVIASGLPTLGG